MRLSLSGAASPASLSSRKVTAPDRRGRAIAPQRVNRIAVDRDQFRTGAGASLSQSFGLFAGVQPGVVAELGALFQILLEPLLGRVLHQVLDRKNLAVDLSVRLHRVAAIDEQRRAVSQNDGRARRAGEAGEPGQPLLACGQIFVLLAVGARHDEPVEAAALELGCAIRRRAPRSARARSNHRTTESGPRTSNRTSNALRDRSNAGMRKPLARGMEQSCRNL